MNLPLNQKTIAIVAVSVAVIVAAIAAIVVSVNRADEARKYAEAARKRVEENFLVGNLVKGMEMIYEKLLNL